MTDTIDEPVRPGARVDGRPVPRRGDTPARAALEPDALRRPGARGPRRLPGRLPACVVEAHPWRRERGTPDHCRSHRHLHLLRGAVELLPDGHQHRQPLRPGGLHHPARPGGALRPDPQRDRPVGRLRRRRRRGRRDGPDRGPHNWPWWAGLIVGMAVCAVIGVFQGTIITRLRIPRSWSPWPGCSAGRAS